MQFGPVIPSSSVRYVHHILVYLCSNLDHTHVGASSECDNANIDIGLCRRGGILIAAWAVGGEVSAKLNILPYDFSACHMKWHYRNLCTLKMWHTLLEEKEMLNMSF